MSADPFDVRIRFSSQLQHLNASVVGAQKAAQYALKHCDMSEDLHSCIIEQLEKVNDSHFPEIFTAKDQFSILHDAMLALVQLAVEAQQP